MKEIGRQIEELEVDEMWHYIKKNEEVTDMD